MPLDPNFPHGITPGLGCFRDRYGRGGTMLPCWGKPGRTARFALLWTALSFVGWQVLVSAGLACWRANLGDVAYRVKVGRLRERLREAPGRPLVLLLGSSRTLVG